MDITEIKATTSSPYRCFVRGKNLQSEGEFVKTLGFKDGLAVVQLMMNPNDKITMSNPTDNTQALDLTKLHRITVQVDPQTGKKFIIKNGKRIVIVPQIKRDSPVKLPVVPPKPAITIKKGLQKIITSKNCVVMPRQVTPDIAPRPKYTVYTVGRRHPVDKAVQTDSQDVKDKDMQTDPIEDSGGSIFNDQFLSFILSDDTNPNCQQQTRKMIDPGKLRTKDEIDKFRFFTDMRSALNFDLAGNLPIHDNVIQNKPKEVQRNCVVLKAIRQSVNIFNRQNYTPLHLAILLDVDVAIVKSLLTHGASITTADPNGNTAIHLAVEHNRKLHLRELMAAVPRGTYNIDTYNFDGFTSLIIACLNRSYPNCQLLLTYGANPNVKDMKSGRTALFHAAENHDVQLVELLMQFGADTKIRNYFGTSPHDAMFELDEVPLKIKISILGRDHQKWQMKRQSRTEAPTTRRGGDVAVKKQKLQTKAVLRTITCAEIQGAKKN